MARSDLSREQARGGRSSHRAATLAQVGAAAAASTWGAPLPEGGSTGHPLGNGTGLVTGTGVQTVAQACPAPSSTECHDTINRVNTRWSVRQPMAERALA